MVMGYDLIKELSATSTKIICINFTNRFSTKRSFLPKGVMDFINKDKIFYIKFLKSQI